MTSKRVRVIFRGDVLWPAERHTDRLCVLTVEVDGRLHRGVGANTRDAARNLDLAIRLDGAVALVEVL